MRVVSPRYIATGYMTHWEVEHNKNSITTSVKRKRYLVDILGIRGIYLPGIYTIVYGIRVVIYPLIHLLTYGGLSRDRKKKHARTILFHGAGFTFIFH